jgi:pimeloyl-ACP methyl ester carboxylesterase
MCNQRRRDALEPDGRAGTGAGTTPAGLTDVEKPVLVVNGDDDTMMPTVSSFHLAELLPDAQLSIYPDSGHGGIFQHHDVFVAQALDFLRD